MRTALVGFAVALPMLLFFVILMGFIEGYLGVSTVLLCAFAICAVTITAFVFHGEAITQPRAEEET